MNDRARDSALPGKSALHLTRQVGAVALWGALAALLALPASGHAPLIVSTVDTMTLALFVLSLNLLVGYAGMISMGHAAFFATGGYVAGLLSKFFGLSMVFAFSAGILSAALLALVVGFFSIRVTQDRKSVV